MSLQRQARERLLTIAILLLGNGPGYADVGGTNGTRPDTASVEFFEKSVRPILVERCMGCHGEAKQKGELRLDTREAALTGGATGPAVVPGKPRESLLVDAINYGDAFKMPPKSKLPDAEIAALTNWVERGAPWGLSSVPKRVGAGPASRIATLDDPAEFRRRASHWCFRPIRNEPVPRVEGGHRDWPRNPIDTFILAGLKARGLEPAPEAVRRTLIRRLSFDLIGLPPTPEEVASFLRDNRPDAYEALVDRLLASPRYGERWGRHWLDLVRYAESFGHEFDYDILTAFRYRDYMIRALNADLPYDRFIIEHVAGDLLERPRRHPADGTNESVLATGFYFLGEGTHSPVDIREDEVRRVDNQIDVFSKTFLGLTVGCARCHDHKFDPIRTKDYYALAGYLQSSRLQYAFVDPPERISKPVERLTAIKGQVRAILREAATKLPPGLRLNDGAGVVRARQPSHQGFELFNGADYEGWYVTGQAFGSSPSSTGDFRLELQGPTLQLIPVAAGQAHSGLLSKRLQGVLRSRTFTIEKRFVHTLASGSGGRINLVIDGFEKNRSPIYGDLTRGVNSGEQPRWITQDVGMWIGHAAYLEIADGGTASYEGSTTRFNDGNGFVAVDEVLFSDHPTPPLLASSQASVDLNRLLEHLRGNAPALFRKLDSALTEYQAIERGIPAPTLALAMADGTGEDERVMIRGNHRNLGEPVHRRLPEILGGLDQATPAIGSGRLDLAIRMVDTRLNPLVPRVAVNRLWKHHFGDGLVRTTDDFGSMGQEPRFPGLLDWLASELVEQGWSLKRLHRMMVTSSTYRMASTLRPEAEKIDPANESLHRMNVRRLEAEAIRDSLLAVSGKLSGQIYGPSVAPYLSPFMEGRGRPARSGPLDGEGRRSVYLNVRRNFLNPMLMAFDAPVPFSTMGRRNVSNVPAQALTLLNDPLVIGMAGAWADRQLAEPELSPGLRIVHLFETAFSRPPTEEELRRCLDFLADRTGSRATWADLCHVLINVKEFLFID